MYPDHRAKLAIFALLAGLFLAAGCLGKSAQNSFYTLTPMPEAAAEARPGAGPCLALGVGPVELPAYLERPQMVTRKQGHRFELAEFDRWAEPLPDTVSRVLAENLAALTCAEPLHFYPWSSDAVVDRQVTVRILRLDGEPGGEVVLQAHWSILDGDEKSLTWRSATYRHTCADGTFGAYAKAQSELLADLSRDIAAALGGLQASAPKQ